MCSAAKEMKLLRKCFEAKTINLLSYYEQMNRKNDSELSLPDCILWNTWSKKKVQLRKSKSST